jgi:5-carboxymethyl-2-hydroxymuconate isomerase
LALPSPFTLWQLPSLIRQNDMPHIIIEYSKNSILEPQQMVQTLFKAIEQLNIFNPDNIKIRCHVSPHFQTGLSNGFVHIQCRTHPGKSLQQKQTLTKCSVEHAKAFATNASITAEVMEMATDSYHKSIV